LEGKVTIIVELFRSHILTLTNNQESFKLEDREISKQYIANDVGIQSMPMTETIKKSLFYLYKLKLDLKLFNQR
jgi:hypothetical protein